MVQTYLRDAVVKMSFDISIECRQTDIIEREGAVLPHLYSSEYISLTLILVRWTKSPEHVQGKL